MGQSAGEGAQRCSIVGVQGRLFLRVGRPPPPTHSEKHGPCFSLEMANRSNMPRIGSSPRKTTSASESRKFFPPTGAYFQGLRCREIKPSFFPPKFENKQTNHDTSASVVDLGYCYVGLVMVWVSVAHAYTFHTPTLSAQTLFVMLLHKRLMNAETKTFIKILSQLYCCHPVQ